LAALLLLAAAWALAALAVADLVYAVTDGGTLIFGPVIGLALGRLARRSGASRRSSRLAIGANAGVLALTAVAILLFGGS
jgi:hypothetical protein